MSTKTPKAVTKAQAAFLTDLINDVVMTESSQSRHLKKWLDASDPIDSDMHHLHYTSARRRYVKAMVGLINMGIHLESPASNAALIEEHANNLAELEPVEAQVLRTNWANNNRGHAISHFWKSYFSGNSPSEALRSTECAYPQIMTLGEAI